MGLDHTRAEIARLRVQVRRQHKDIASLQKARISTAAAIALLKRMEDQIDALCSERDRLKGEARMEPQPTYVTGKVIRGTPNHRRGL